MSRRGALILSLACAGCFSPRAGGGDVDAGSAGVDAASVDGGPPPSGEICAEAIPLVSAGEVAGSTVGLDDDYEGTGLGCPGTTQPESDVVYAIDVPPSSRLLASVEPEGGFDSVLMIVDEAACASVPTGCLGADDTGDAGNPDVASWTNETAAPARAFVIVDGYDSGDGAGTFTLRTGFDGAAIGESCETPTVLPGVGELRYQTTAGYRNELDGAPCVSGGLTGGEHVYRVAVPRGKTWQVVVEPGHGFDPTVYAFVASGGAGSGCGATCASASETAGTGLAEVVTLEGGVGGATYWVVVDGVEAGAYTVTVQVVP